MTLISCGASKEVHSEDKTSSISINEIEKLSIFEKLQENNHLSIEDRISLYHQLKKDHADEYNFESDRELNQYGYSLMSEDKINEAIEIFKLLISEFPDLSNPYDSLGEAYLKDGNEELALVNYEKSVELDPKNTMGIDQITQLKGLEILVTDWGKEFFHFPLHFAPEIAFEGVEEVVFPKNWIKPDSADFWSYVFVWALDNKKDMSAHELEEALKLYFDGLMARDDGEQDAEMIKTSASFQRSADAEDDVDLIGELTIFDAFATNQPLNLNAKMYSNYCEERGKLILHFQFSPQEFGHPVWNLLETVLIRKSICEK